MNTYKTFERIILGAAIFLFVVLLLILCLPESYTSWCIPISSGQKITVEIYNQVSVCLLLMSVSALLIFIYWNRKKWIVFNLAMMVFVLFLAEEFTLVKQPKSRASHTIEKPSFYEKDSALGYHLIGNLDVESVCHDDTLLLYDVIYTLDKNGQRITSLSSTKYDGSKQCIAFLGCSYTFGIGLNDDQTLPFKVQDELPDIKVYNFGVSGYGPNQVLKEVESGIIDSTLKQPPQAFIFSTIQDHLRRLEDPDEFYVGGPQYAINQKTGQLEYQGHFNAPKNLKENKFFSKIKKSTFYNFLIHRQVAKRRGQLLVAHILKIRDVLLEQYPKATFHVISWDFFGEDNDRDIIKALRGANVNLHIINHIIPNYFDDFPNLIVRFPYEFHPSAKANKQISRYVLDRIIKRDVYFDNNAHEFNDGFDSLTRGSWHPVDFDLPENTCDMLASQVKYSGGKAKITMAINDSTNGKPFVSGGISSQKYFRYGRFTASIKADLASGSYAYMELMNQWRPDFWEHKAVDIYFLGKNLTQVTFSVKSFKIDDEDSQEINKQCNLDFNASKEFHNYSIDWSKDSISFLIDGTVVFTEKSITFDEEMNVSLSHWAASPEGGWLIDWLGKLDQSKLPSTFEVDNFSYQPLKKVNEDGEKYR